MGEREQTDEEIVVSNVLMDGLRVVVDPPARFVPLHTPRGWTVAANEFMLTPRARSRAALPAECERAVWNLAVVLRALDEPAVQCGAPATLLARATALRRRFTLHGAATFLGED